MERFLANPRGEVASGTLCLLTKTATTTRPSARSCPSAVTHVASPADGQPAARPGALAHRSSRHAARTSTALDPATLVDDDGFRFLLQLQLRGDRHFCRTQVYDPRTRTTCDGVLLDACDGSHAEVITNPEPDGQRPVIQAGPRRLWDSVEATYQLWRHLGRPDPGRFGVVANPTTQFVWFDIDEGWYRWPLPLA